MKAWGKFDREHGEYLPLIVHLCDVSACFSVLADLPLYADRLISLAKREMSETFKQQLYLLAFIHDVGKLNIGFQAKGWFEADRYVEKAGHTTEGLDLLICAEAADAIGLPDIFDRWGAASESLLLSTLSHHGKPINLDRYSPKAALWQPAGTYDPISEAQRVRHFMHDTFPKAIDAGEELPQNSEFQHLFAGLVALADQIGSMTEYFPLNREEKPQLFADCLGRAKLAIASLQLDVSSIRSNYKSLPPNAIFGWPEEANLKPMQEICWQLDQSAHLAILESETGSGKTEAALLRFIRLFTAGHVDGLYFAVPTRAAASALHRRIDQAAQRILSTNAVLAVPGYLKIGDATGHPLPDWKVLWDDAPDEQLRAARWAAEAPRRFLAAPIAVGTVDQAMMAGLKVKWAHFRAASLSRSLLVVDEVHASDVYMKSVLSQLLDSHIGNGGYALLMSATLGGAARQEWLAGRRIRSRAASAEEHQQVAYPSLSVREKDDIKTIPIPHDGKTKRIRVEAIESMEAPEHIAAIASDAASRGAKVLVIRNTVASALAVQNAIERNHQSAPVLEVEGKKTLHHSRFATEDRLLLDKSIEAHFGKTSPRQPIIAVGTQTLEQSLDISCDILISDLCPIDVLLQRIGRLHRHSAERPEEFRQPICRVLVPKDLKPTASLLKYGLGQGTNGGVYQSVTGLEATRQLIEKRPVWAIPEDNRLLVEHGTDPTRLDELAITLGEDWRRERQGVEGRGWSHRNAAKHSILDRSTPFDGRTEVFPDDERILTRIGANNIVLKFAPVEGPFGKPVSQIVLPSHMLGSASADDALNLEVKAEGLELGLGPSLYRYSCHGLEKTGNA